MVGLCFTVRTIAKTAFRKECSIAAVTLILFGFSDIVEASTGAWWRPWWLFVWKALCVLILLMLLISYFRWKRKAGLDMPPR